MDHTYSLSGVGSVGTGGYLNGLVLTEDWIIP